MGVIYIVGLAHSGTTIIDRTLSCYQSVTGLGEVEQACCPVGLQPLATSDIFLVHANQHAIADNKFALSSKREKLTYDNAGLTRLRWKRLTRRFMNCGSGI